MTLQDFITKYDGKVVADGQCGNLVRAYWNEVDKTTPPSYPNSKDYWFNEVPGYDKVHNPQLGDIAIYNGHGAYTEGHSAIYVDGRVFEQNADPDGSPAHLYPRKNTNLLGYLRKQGEDMTLTQEQVNKICVLATNLEASSNQNFLNNVGQDLDTVLDNFLNYTESKNLRLDAEAYRKGQTGVAKVIVNDVPYVPSK